MGLGAWPYSNSSDVVYMDNPKSLCKKDVNTLVIHKQHELDFLSQPSSDGENKLDRQYKKEFHSQWEKRRRVHVGSSVRVNCGVKDEKDDSSSCHRDLRDVEPEGDDSLGGETSALNMSDKFACKSKLLRESRRGSLSHKWNWFLLGTILFLSVLGRCECVNVFDDDEFDDLSNPFSATYRRRRSAEAFSTIKDAESLIPANYSIHEPPPTNNSEATKVDFSVLIMNVRDIKELNEELSLEMNLRIYWKDTRLGHLADRSGTKFIVLNPVVLDKIWHPDTFIDHVKSVAQPALISKPASLRIYPDSSIRYSARITVSMACQMDFHYYPADTQRCNVDIKSYAYSSKVLLLDWREGKGAILVDYLDLPNFDVALDTTQNFMVNTSSGSYSGVRFTILLRRKLSYHLIQTYLPSALFIVVSWLSFLVPPESVPGRMALCMTTLLTLTAMFSAVRQNTPNVSYVKALDIWMVVCIIFVFLTLVEYTVLLKLKSKKPKPKENKIPPPQPQAVVQTPPPVTNGNGQNGGSQSALPTISYRSYGEYPTIQMRRPKLTETSFNGNDPTRPSSDPTVQTLPQIPPMHAPPPPPVIAQEKPINKYELAANKIEDFTSAIIPTMFVVFNFIYWPWLIESAHYYSHDVSHTVHGSV